MSNSHDHLRTFYLSFGPVLNRSGLEASLNLPRRCVYDWLTGKQGMPAAHRPLLEAWARRYGYSEDIQYDSFL